MNRPAQPNPPRHRSTMARMAAGVVVTSCAMGLFFLREDLALIGRGSGSGSGTSSSHSPGPERPGGSAEVHFSFPTDNQALSVGRNGQAQAALEVPTFQSIVPLSLRAIYNSHAGDGLMGVGWDIHTPHIRLDLDDGFDNLITWPSENIVDANDGIQYVKDRWKLSTGTDLVCEQGAAGDNAWGDFDCFTEPRGDVRYKIELDDNYLPQAFVATDPHSGHVQIYGRSEAAIVRNDEGRPVAWYLHQEENRTGQRLTHRYEELAGTAWRLRVAIEQGGDRVVRFRYRQRSHDVRSHFRWGVERRLENLLESIELLPACTTTQRINESTPVGVNRARTDFGGGCDSFVEKIVVDYDEGWQRFSGRTVMRRWQHLAADTRFEPVLLSYSGDENSPVAGGEALDNSDDSAQDFDMPPGTTLPTAMGHGPFQTLYDWNKDGLPDLVTTKGNESNWWPNAEQRDERYFHVYRRRDGGFDDDKISFVDPISTQAFMRMDADRILLYHENLDIFAYGDDSHVDDDVGIDLIDCVDGCDLETDISRHHPRASIGIDLDWGYFEAHRPTTYYGGGAISATVVCTEDGSATDSAIPQEACDQIIEAYNCVYSEDRRNYGCGSSRLPTGEQLGVKIFDLTDMNGDGYLDRVLSGLIVRYDPLAPDADPSTGLRPLEHGPIDPAIYVSLFDPDRGEHGNFGTWQRIEVADEDEAGFEGVNAHYLSALAVVHTYDKTPSPAAESSLRSAVALLGVVNSATSLLEWGERATTSSGIGPFENATGRQSSLSVSEAIGGATMAVNAGINVVDRLDVLSPETESKMRNAGDAIGKAASFAQIGIGVGNPLGTAIQLSFFAARLALQSENALSQDQVVMINLGLASASFALSLLPPLTPIGLIAGIVAFSYSVIASVMALLHSESFERAAGTVRFDVVDKRGYVYTEDGHNNHQTTDRTLLSWRDFNADGRPDLVLGRYNNAADGWGFAPSQIDVDANVFATGRLRGWLFEDSKELTPPRFLSDSSSDDYYSEGDIHRGDLVRAELSLIDMNADGLPDLVDAYHTSSQGFTGYYVYPNTGNGWAPPVAWAITPSAHYDESVDYLEPPGCPHGVKISRGRNLQWIELFSESEGINFALSTSHQMLGPDIDGNGLPDLVARSEHDALRNHDYGFECAEYSGTEMCIRPMPSDPEPNPSGDCIHGVHPNTAWYAEAYEGADGDGEGTSHLSRTAYQLHSPQVLAATYVAYNTGSGFTEFTELGTMPAFAGSFSATKVGSDVSRRTPDFGVNGTSNLLGDLDGDGRTHLFAFDIGDESTIDVDVQAQVFYERAIGVEHADVLTGIHFPDGGEAGLSYRLKKDVDGTQGRPVLVLDRTTYDDKIAADFAAAHGWEHTNPWVSYSYDGARWNGREYLGFAAIAETRFSGTDVTQLIQAFVQEGPTRGQLSCSEVRGRVVDDNAIFGEEGAQHANCSDRERAADRSGSVVHSCYQDAHARLGLDEVLPLLERRSFGYIDTGSVVGHAGDDDDEILRSIQPQIVQTARYLGGSDPLVTTSVHLANDIPHRTPTEVRVYDYAVALDADVDELAEDAVTTSYTRWNHHNEDWVFLKTREWTVARDGSAAVSTSYSYQDDFPYFLDSVVIDSPTRTRTRSYEMSREAGGKPRRIVDGSIVKDYRYVPSGESGAGLLKQVTTQADGIFMTSPGVESWRYDHRGNVVRHELPSGDEEIFDRNRLGLVENETKPGQSTRFFVYEHVGQPGFSRASSSYQNSARISSYQVVDGEQLWQHTFLDGFSREFRSGRFVHSDSTRNVDMDFDSDGSADYLASSDFHTRFFNGSNGDWLLTDYRLDAKSRRACTSMPYFGGSAPEAYRSELKDSLELTRFEEDVTGFAKVTSMRVEGGLEVRTTTDDLDVTSREYLDAHGRTVETDEAGLLHTRIVYDDLGREVMQTILDEDGLAGPTTIHEVNAWGQVRRTCYRERFAQPIPTDGQCPEDWATEEKFYNDDGRLSGEVDTVGARTDYVYGTCVQAGRITFPSTSVEEVRRSSVERTFDASCRVDTEIGRDGVTTRFKYAFGDAVSHRGRIGIDDGVSTSTRNGYDAAGRLAWTQNGRGYRTYTLSDFRGLAIETYAPHADLSDPVVTTHAYDRRGHLRLATDPVGHDVEMDYDLLGRMTERRQQREVCGGSSTASASVTSVVEVRERWEYDEAGRRVAEVGANASRREYGYDDLGRPRFEFLPSAEVSGETAEHDDGSRVQRQIEYDDFGFIHRERDAAGGVVEYVRDLRGRASEVRRKTDDGDWSTTAYAFDGEGRVVHEFAPNADDSADACTEGASGPFDFAMSTTYAPDGQAVSTTSPADQRGERHTTTRVFDAAGRLDNETDARGNTTRFSYDSLGRLWQTLLADDTSTEKTYDENDNVVGERGRNGLWTIRGYDHADRIVEVTPPTMLQKVIGYGRRGQKLFEAAEVGLDTERWEARLYHHSDDGALTEVETAYAERSTPPTRRSDFTSLFGERFCVDEAGNGRRKTDADGVTWVMDFDLRNRAVAEHLPATDDNAAVRIETEYDDEDRIISVVSPMHSDTGPALLTTDYRYDLAGRLTSEQTTQADDVRFYEYDASGNLCAEKDKDGGSVSRQIDRVYDARGLIVAETSDFGSGLEVALSYDESGNLVEAVDETGTWTYRYTDVGELYEQVQRIDELDASFTTTKTFDDEGRWKTLSVSSSDEHETEFAVSYDEETGLIDAVSRDGVDFIADVVWDGRGRIWNHQRRLGAVINSYDEAGRLERRLFEYDSDTLYDASYGYDGRGNITSVIDHVDADYSQTIDVDSRSRIVGVHSDALASTAWGGTAYQLYWNDANLLETKSGERSVDVAPPAGADGVAEPAYLPADDVAVTSGTMLTDRLQYDTSGRLAGYISGLGDRHDYAYDRYGARSDDGQRGLSFERDAHGRVYEVVEDSDRREVRYAYDTRRVQYGDSFYVYGFGKDPVVTVVVDDGGAVTSSETSFRGALVGMDAVGLVETINADGTLIIHGTDRLGSPVVGVDDSGSASGYRAYDVFGNELTRGAELTTAVSFQGALLDDTGYQPMHFRQYDALTMQFDRLDPLGLQGGPSRFAFASANPARFVDPWGLSDKDAGAEVAADDLPSEPANIELSHVDQLMLLAEKIPTDVASPTTVEELAAAATEARICLGSAERCSAANGSFTTLDEMNRDIVNEALHADAQASQFQVDLEGGHARARRHAEANWAQEMARIEAMEPEPEQVTLSGGATLTAGAGLWAEGLTAMPNAFYEDDGQFITSDGRRGRYKTRLNKANMLGWEAGGAVNAGASRDDGVVAGDAVNYSVSASVLIGVDISWSTNPGEPWYKAHTIKASGGLGAPGASISRTETSTEVEWID